jgi:hypothetical protein
MNCYECALTGTSVPAVSVCHHCAVGLCLEHAQESQEYRVGGTRFGCPHQSVAAANRRPTPGSNRRRVASA